MLFKIKVIIFFTFLFFSGNNFISAEESLDTLVQENCLGCHSNPDLKAPSLQSMSWATKQELMYVMNEGKMKAQSSHLSDQQKESIADYISNSIDDNQIRKCKFSLENKGILGRNHWVGWGLNHTNNRNQISSVINSNNVNKLKFKWAFNIQGYESRSPPVVLGDLLIIGTNRGLK